MTTIMTLLSVLLATCASAAPVSVATLDDLTLRLTTATLPQTYVLGTAALSCATSTSLDGHGSTLDAGGHADRLMTVVGNATTLSVHNLTFSSGTHAFRAGAIELRSADGLNASSCSFVSNTATAGSGGAIYAEEVSSGVFVEHSVFVANVAGSDGGALATNNASGVIFSCSFERNRAAGTAGALRGGGRMRVRNTIFSTNNGSNATQGFGAGAAWFMHASTLTHCSFRENKAEKGWYGAVRVDNIATLFGCHFRGNAAASQGGALGSWHADTCCPRAINPTPPHAIVDCIFESNRVAETGSDGGAIVLVNGHEVPTVVHVNRSQFVGNTAPQAAAMWLQSGYEAAGSHILAECSLMSNLGGSSVGSVRVDAGVFHAEHCSFYANNAGGKGGALFFAVSYNLARPPGILRDSTFCQNTAKNGGAVFVHGGSWCRPRLAFESCSLEANTASEHGGGVFVKETGRITAIQTAFIGNTAASRGGGLYIDDGTVRLRLLRRCVFRGNRAPLGASIGLRRPSRFGDSLFDAVTLRRSPSASVRRLLARRLTTPSTEYSNSQLSHSSSGCANEVNIPGGVLVTSATGTFESYSSSTCHVYLKGMNGLTLGHVRSHPNGKTTTSTTGFEEPIRLTSYSFCSWWNPCKLIKLELMYDGALASAEELEESRLMTRVEIPGRLCTEKVDLKGDDRMGIPSDPILTLLTSDLGRCNACPPETTPSFSTPDDADWQFVAAGPGRAGGNAFPHFTVECAACPAGKLWGFDELAGTSLCKSCIPTNYKSNTTTGALVSLPCPRGYRCGDCSSKTPCALGSFQAAKSASHCDACAAGTFTAATGESSCNRCLPGRYQPGSGETSCRPCSLGRYQSSKSATVCEGCAVGFYAVETGRSVCKTCDNCGAGSHVNVSSLNANEIGLLNATCPGVLASVSNVLKNDTVAYCKACPLGMFAARTNLQECTLCPKGYFGLSSPPFTNCPMCAAGRHTNREGLLACTSCSEGRMQPAPGRSVCKACSEGETALAGSVSCDFCPEGFRAAGRVCEACVAGTFARGIKQTTCFDCKAGQFQHNNKAADCRLCAMGTAQNASGATVCKACERGRMMSYRGGLACQTCRRPTVEYTDGAGALICKTCADNSRVAASMDTCRCLTPVQAKNPKTGKPFEEGMRGFDPGFFEVGFEISPRLAAIDKDPDLAGLLRPQALADSSSCLATGTTVSDTIGCCQSCPVGAKCAHGVLFIRAGYWRKGGAPRGAPIIKLCPVPSSCPGSVHLLERLQSLMANATRHAGTTSETNTTLAVPGEVFVHDAEAGPCTLGHRGDLCALCAEDYKPQADGSCIHCGFGGSNNTAKILLGALGSLLLLGLVTYIATLPTKYSTQHSDDLGRLDDTADDTSQLGDNFFTMLPYVQRLSAVGVAFQFFDFPPAMLALVEFLQIAYANVADVFTVISPCSLHMTFGEKLAMQICIVPYMLAIALGAYAIAAHGRRILRRRREVVLVRLRRSRSESDAPGSSTISSDVQTRGSRRRGSSFGIGSMSFMRRKRPLRYNMDAVKIRLTCFLLFSIRFLYPGIGSMILRSFVCVSVGEKRVMRYMVDLECWTPAYWSRIGGLAVAACTVLLLGIPIALAFAVMSEARGWRRQIVEERKEKARVLDNLFRTHVSLLDRVKRKAHHVHVVQHHHTAEFRHQVIKHFVRLFKRRYWWWFLVEMLMSLFFIGVLAIFDDVDVNVTVGGAGSLLQILLPALLWPYAQELANHIALASGVLYYVTFLGGLALLLGPEASIAESIIMVVVVLILVCITAVLLHTLYQVTAHVGRACKSDRRRLAKMRRKSMRRKQRQRRRTKKRHNKVVPAREAASSPQTNATQGKDVAAAHKSSRGSDMLRKYNRMLPALRRIQIPSQRVVEACDAALSRAYLEAWEKVLSIHVEVVAVSLQAAVRGFAGRRALVGQTQTRPGPTGRLFLRAVDLRGEDAVPTTTMTSAKRRGSSRLLLHSQTETRVFLDALTEYENDKRQQDGLDAKEEKEGNGGGGGGIGTKATELLRTAKGFSHDEISGLHENGRVTDAQMVALISLQHAAEHEASKELLKQEEVTQRNKGLRRQVKRRLAHRLRQSSLGKDTSIERDVAIFNALDADGSGTISIAELLDAPIFKDGSSSDDNAAEISDLLKSLDRDGDSTSLSLDEFSQLMRNNRRSSTAPVK